MVIHNDILKVDVQKLCDIYSEGKPLKVVANLPYYITTPIIMGLFESHNVAILLLFFLPLPKRHCTINLCSIQDFAAFYISCMHFPLFLK